MENLFALPLLEWINIPLGKVMLDRHGAFEVAEFAISKYPVTNALYQAFINDGGGKVWRYDIRCRKNPVARTTITHVKW